MSPAAARAWARAAPPHSQMSFPGLAVKVKRHRRCVLEYSDEGFERRRLELEGDLSELVQHEYDHLDGILATMRAVDDKSLYMMQLKREF